MLYHPEEKVRCAAERLVRSRQRRTLHPLSQEGIHYGKSAKNSDVDRGSLGPFKEIGDIARRAFYPQQAATLKKEEVQRLNAELEHIAEKMESINTWMDAAVKRAAAAG